MVAEDLVTALNYTIHVNRSPRSYAQLSGLALSTGNLTPAFDPAVKEYSVAYPHGSGSIKVTPKTAETVGGLTGPGRRGAVKRS